MAKLTQRDVHYIATHVSLLVKYLFVLQKYMQSITTETLLNVHSIHVCYAYSLLNLVCYKLDFTV